MTEKEKMSRQRIYDANNDTDLIEERKVAKYDNYELGSFSEEAKHAWLDAHWEEDLQKAYDAGRRMAEQ